MKQTVQLLAISPSQGSVPRESPGSAAHGPEPVSDPARPERSPRGPGARSTAGSTWRPTERPSVSEVADISWPDRRPGLSVRAQVAPGPPAGERLSGPRGWAAPPPRLPSWCVFWLRPPTASLSTMVSACPLVRERPGGGEVARNQGWAGLQQSRAQLAPKVGPVYCGARPRSHTEEAPCAGLSQREHGLWPCKEMPEPKAERLGQPPPPRLGVGWGRRDKRKNCPYI